MNMTRSRGGQILPQIDILKNEGAKLYMTCSFLWPTIIITSLVCMNYPIFIPTTERLWWLASPFGPPILCTEPNNKALPSPNVVVSTNNFTHLTPKASFWLCLYFCNMQDSMPSYILQHPQKNLIHRHHHHNRVIALSNAAPSFLHHQ